MQTQAVSLENSILRADPESVTEEPQQRGVYIRGPWRSQHLHPGGATVPSPRWVLQLTEVGALTEK